MDTEFIILSIDYKYKHTMTSLKSLALKDHIITFATLQSSILLPTTSKAIQCIYNSLQRWIHTKKQEAKNQLTFEFDRLKVKPIFPSSGPKAIRCIVPLVCDCTTGLR